MDIKGEKNSFFVANLYTVVSLFIEKWSCWCHAYFNARALKCHFEALSFWYFCPIRWKNIGWGKVTMQQVVVITAYCTRLLHEKSSLNTVLDCQDQIRCSFAEKKNQSLFYVSLYCLVWRSAVFVCSPMKVKPARKQKLEDQTMWKWQWQQSKLSFWPTTSPMIFCCSHVLCHFSVDISSVTLFFWVALVSAYTSEVWRCGAGKALSTGQKNVNLIKKKSFPIKRIIMLD